MSKNDLSITITVVAFFYVLIGAIIMTTEVDLYKEFKKTLLASHVAERVENKCASGMPDVYVKSNLGSNFWIENKICNWDEVINIRPSQIIWHLEHTIRYNCKSFVLIAENKEIKRNYFFLDMSQLTYENYKKLYRPKTLKQLSEMQVKYNKKKFFWGVYPNMSSLQSDLLSIVDEF